MKACHDFVKKLEEKVTSFCEHLYSQKACWVIIGAGIIFRISQYLSGGDFAKQMDSPGFTVLAQYSYDIGAAARRKMKSPDSLTGVERRDVIYLFQAHVFQPSHCVS